MSPYLEMENAIVNTLKNAAFFSRKMRLIERVDDSILTADNYIEHYGHTIPCCVVRVDREGTEVANRTGGMTDYLFRCAALILSTSDSARSGKEKADGYASDAERVLAAQVTGQQDFGINGITQDPGPKTLIDFWRSNNIWFFVTTTEFSVFVNKAIVNITEEN